jgi:hypothetical protein
MRRGPVLYRLAGRPSGARPTRTSRGTEVRSDPTVGMRPDLCEEAGLGLVGDFCTRRVVPLRILFRRTLKLVYFV